MINAGDHRPGRVEAVRLLAGVAPAYEAAGVTLALETYEQVPVDTLVDVVASVGSAAVDICLDPANCVAALELPAATIERTAPYVCNVHVKDFHFTRQDGWVGFNLVGCPLGEGLLPFDQLTERLAPLGGEPSGGELSQIIEHWLPWQGDSATTIALEQRWTEHNLSYLRSMHSWTPPHPAARSPPPAARA